MKYLSFSGKWSAESFSFFFFALHLLFIILHCSRLILNEPGIVEGDYDRFGEEEIEEILLLLMIRQYLFREWSVEADNR